MKATDTGTNNIREIKDGAETAGRVMFSLSDQNRKGFGMFAVTFSKHISKLLFNLKSLLQNRTGAGSCKEQQNGLKYA